MTKIIKGTPRDKWEEVQAIQGEPFIFIMGNGSRWAGEEEGDISELLECLSSHDLDTKRFGPSFWNDDPCAGIVNPDWTWENKVPHYIDGPRLYKADGVVRFFGNFFTISHGFSIDTNHVETIQALKDAISDNIERQRKAA